MNKHIIYLAAGNSRRFGSNKLLYEYQGKPLYRHGLDMLLEIAEENEDTTLTVVTQYWQIEQELRAAGVKAVLSEESKKGISYSIRAGLGAVGETPEEDYVVFVVADQPCLTKQTVEKLLECADGKTETAAVGLGQRLGNPALFSMKYREELLALTGDQGGRAVLRRHQCRCIAVSDEKELADIDRKEDFQTVTL